MKRRAKTNKCEYCGKQCECILKPHEACCICYESYMGPEEGRCPTCEKRITAKSIFEQRKQTLPQFFGVDILNERI